MSSISEIANQTNLSIGALQVHSDPASFAVPDPMKPEGMQQAKHFVTLPESLSGAIPGSEVLPQEFVTHLFGNGEHAGSLIKPETDSTEEGDQIKGVAQPILSYGDDTFSLEVYYPSLHHDAQEIARLAASPDGADDVQIRAAYQQHCANLLNGYYHSAKQADLTVKEDCLASGDTLIGLITIAKSIYPDLKTVQFDALVASTPGLMVVQAFAQQNDIVINIRVGYLAYGLSTGEPIQGSKARAHANYITYPQSFQEHHHIQQEYVVGDMGDLFQSLPDSFDQSHPWNAYRVYDTHGVKQPSQRLPAELSGNSMPFTVYLANGGYAMKAFADAATGHDTASDQSQVIFKASRVWSSDEQYGYGVAIR